MAPGDLIHNLELPLTPDGQLDLAVFNKQFMQVQERINALEGRSQPSQIRDDLSVLGAVTATGGLAGATLALERNSLRPSDPSYAPTVETALTPQALLLSSPLDTGVDLSAPVSPFTVNVKDEFLGGENSFVAEPGDLGWQFSGPAGFAATASAGHPGVCIVQDGGGVNAIYLNVVFAEDVRYLAAVVSLSASREFSFGLSENVTAPTGTAAGMYFAVVNPPFTNWRTMTFDGVMTQAFTSDYPATANEWVLLEILIDPAAPTVDFYLNRQRCARHTQGLLLSTPLSPFFSGTALNYSVDRFLLTGTPSVKIWTTP